MVTLDDFTDAPRPLTPDLRAELLSHVGKSTSHQLRGLRAGRESLAIYLWLDSDSETFDVELVFWSDQLFPQPDDESACLDTFRDYLALAESIRAVSPRSECVLSASETGDPRDHREKSWTHWW